MRKGRTSVIGAGPLERSGRRRRSNGGGRDRPRHRRWLRHTRVAVPPVSFGHVFSFNRGENRARVFFSRDERKERTERSTVRSVCVRISTKYRNKKRKWELCHATNLATWQSVNTIDILLCF